MDDALGIYNNNTIYNKNTFDVNKHMEQGVSFINYSKMYSNAKENKFSYLSDTSTPNIVSIVEAMQGDQSSIDTNARHIRHERSEQEEQFNSLLSSYTALYNTFNASLLKPNPSADDLAQRKIMEQDLSAKYMQLSSLARNIQNNLQKWQATRNGDMNELDINRQLWSKIKELERQQRKMEHTQYRSDINTIDGQLETTALANTSFQLHYLVYLIVFITVFAFILNLSINPNANVVNAIYVLGALLAVYVITRWII